MHASSDALAARLKVSTSTLASFWKQGRLGPTDRSTQGNLHMRLPQPVLLASPGTHYSTAAIAAPLHRRQPA